MFKKIHAFFHAHYHRRYHGIYRHAKQLFIFDLVLLGLAIILLAAGAVLFFWKPGIGDQVEIQISLGNDKIRSGDNVTLSVSYVNHSKLTLEKPTLALRLPFGFLQTTSTPKEPLLSDNNTLELPAIAPGAEGAVILHGTLWTEPQKEERLTATLSFERSDNRETEHSVAAYLLNLSASVLESNIEIATTTFPGQPLTFTYRLTNASDQPLDNVDVVIFPSGVTFDKPFNAKNISLKARETKIYHGKLAIPNKPGTIILSFTPRFTVKGRALPQSTARDTKTITVFYPSTRSALTWENTPRYIEPGDTLVANVSWKNTSDFTLKEQHLRITFNPALVDLRKTARENNLKIDGGALVADKSNRTLLADGAPGSAGSFRITLYFLPSFGPIATNRFESRADFEAQIDQIPGVYFSNPGAGDTVPLATTLTLGEQVRYYTSEGDQLGRGPLPPTVGETTKYWVWVEVTNSTNAVRDVSFSAILAPGVIFTDKQSVTIGPELTYNSANRTVSWNYKKLPAHSTTGLYFEVSVTPGVNDVGSKLTLINSSRLRAVDDVVEKEFLFSRGALTNVLPSSDRGSNLGAEVVGE